MHQYAENQETRFLPHFICQISANCKFVLETTISTTKIYSKKEKSTILLA